MCAHTSFKKQAVGTSGKGPCVSAWSFLLPALKRGNFYFEFVFIIFLLLIVLPHMFLSLKTNTYELSENGIIIYVFFCNWLFLTQHYVLEVHLVSAYSCSLFLFSAGSVMLYATLPAVGSLCCWQTLDGLRSKSVVIMSPLAPPLLCWSFSAHTQQHSCWAMGQACLQFCSIMRHCFPEWLYQFSLPPEGNENAIVRQLW